LICVVSHSAPAFLSGRSKESDDEMSAETDVDAKHLTALFSARMVTRLLNHTYAYAENEFRKLETQESGRNEKKREIKFTFG
jgi:hypothetical protein